jgi:GNAT superfamily N-acetyltransferase
LGLAYRLARSEDLDHVAAVFSTSIDDLDKKHGFIHEPTPRTPPNPQYAFWLEKDSGAFWVAEDKGRLVGYTFSFLRGSLWFLADLFIVPTYQGKGIGRGLIERTLGSWKQHRITNRGLITPAFNRSSASLYMRFGMLPRQPLYFATAPREDVDRALGSTEPKRLQIEESASLASVYSTLNQIDKQALGFPLGWHHEFFHTVQRAHCFLFKGNGRPLGYAYVRRNGRVGPLVVTSTKSFGTALEASLHLAARGDSKDLTILFAGSNKVAALASIKFGFRITYPLLYLSTLPVAEWNNYLFYSPGLM